MTERRRLVSADENDVHTRWRRLYCYTQRAGVCAAVKRRTNRRERTEGKRDVERQLREAS